MVGENVECKAAHVFAAPVAFASSTLSRAGSSACHRIGALNPSELIERLFRLPCVARLAMVKHVSQDLGPAQDVRGVMFEAVPFQARSSAAPRRDITSMGGCGLGAASRRVYGSLSSVVRAMVL